MTTATTDAEAIARIVSPDSWKIRDRHVAGANSYPGLTETELANALASAECYVQESLRRATAILSYLASRREAQEPVAHPKIMYVCECCYEHTPEVCGYDRRDIYVTPDGKWLCDGCIDAEDIQSRDCVSPPLLYTAPPPPAGEVERLRWALENTKSAILRADPEILTDTLWMPDDLSRGETVVDHIDAALNGGRADE